MKAALLVALVAVCWCSSSAVVYGQRFLSSERQAVTSRHVGITSTYDRGVRSDELEETHPRLRGSTASNAPEQIHLALAGAHGMTVSWLTPAHVAAADSRVFYGTDPTTLTAVVTGSNATYTCEKTECPLHYASGSIHHAVLQPLAPRTLYFYRIGAAGPFNFTTPPEPGPKSLPVSYTLVGDLGQTANSLTTVEHMTGSGSSVIIHVGDLSYADGYQPRWDTYARMIQPLAAGVPWMTVEGNHEIEAGVGGAASQFLAYTLRYHMTGDSPPAQQQPQSVNPSQPSSLYYSFIHGAATWIMLGSYVDFSATSNQYRWLQKTLASVDKKATPWLFVGLHAPWYNSNSVHQGEGESMRVSMERVVYEAGVDAVFSGHVHSYERCARVFDRAPDPCGPLYINIGDGGNREGLAGPWLKPQPPWSLFRESSYGHGTLEVVNTTHAHWKWNRNQDAAPVTSDSVWMVKHEWKNAPCRHIAYV